MEEKTKIMIGNLSIKRYYKDNFRHGRGVGYWYLILLKDIIMDHQQHLIKMVILMINIFILCEEKDHCFYFLFDENNKTKSCIIKKDNLDLDLYPIIK